ncbi:MAG TPA: IclR family transcriptional regulator [Solirubrobacteraceae bacterium]|jgi:IclR family KDG regulon transcriptional repressor|nr:IclR family transcriptional regulator [Solirubrobacteraceae bacterium]
MSVAPAKPKYSAPAAGCAADILIVLARRGVELSVNDLCEHTGHSKSLVYRTLAELEPRRYVTKLDSGQYTLGLATVELGGAFALQMPLMSSVRRVCRWLAKLTEETVNLGVLQEDQVLYLVREEGGRSVFALSTVGKLLPANAVALGKALLALKTDDCVRDIFASRLEQDGQLTAITKNTITGLDDLVSQLARVRTLGHAEEHGEAVAGRCCMAVTAPFGGLEERAVGLSVSMDEARFQEARDAVLNGLGDARDQISREVRGRAAVGNEASDSDLMIGGMSPW